MKSKFENSDTLCLLFKVIVKVTGLRFTPQALKEFSTNPSSFSFEKPFDDTDLEDLGERVNHIGLVAASIGYYLKDKALMKTGANSTRLFQVTSITTVV